jgi:hypothetical protein
MDHSRILTRSWLLSLLVAAFVAVHLFLFHMFWRRNLPHRHIPGTLIFVVVLVAVAKHMGLLALLLRRFRSIFRR